MGTDKPAVYLLHFDGKYKHAGHYCGWTSCSVMSRYKKHLASNGARLPAVAVKAGCKLQLVRVWYHDSVEEAREHERQLKRSHNLPRFCPICNRRLDDEYSN